MEQFDDDPSLGAMPREQASERTLYNLHVLRVIAAMGVVYYHTTSEAGLDLTVSIGSRGVDVFFVISGFIIAYIGSTNQQQFFRRRLIRVVPFYWAATLFVFLVVLVFPNMLRSTHADVPHLIASLLFIPRDSIYADGVFPTLILGWSLNFEMFFYIVFALSLRISQKWSPLICGAWILGFVAMFHAITTTSTALNFYARPIVLEFVFGIGVYYVFTWFDQRKARLAKIAAGKWLLLVLLATSVLVICLADYHEGWGLPRHVYAGIPGFMIVLTALLLERIYGVTTKNRTIYLLGESSYILYLIHPYIIYTVLRTVIGHRELATPVLIAVIVGLLALSAALSIAIHLWFEKPVMKYLKARLLPS